ncbi:major facilitator superfamily domain-containing protein [Xylariales sp. PMI_506]|nr:major facilitator superfamily domain-containing protein [Xylariales sp. PMI_506]
MSYNSHPGINNGLAKAPRNPYEPGIVESKIHSESLGNGHTTQEMLDVVDFDGPEDPSNPLNWPTWKKTCSIGTISLITLLSAITSTMPSSDSEQILADFKSTNPTLAAFVTTVYLIGYACGPLVIAPLSELYGRAPLYNICNILFIVFNVCCSASGSLAGLIVCRLLAGTAGSCPLTIGAGSIADMIPHERRGLAMAMWAMGPLLGPSIGPLGMIFLKESCAYAILERKTKRLKKETGNKNLRPARHTGESGVAYIASAMGRPLKLLFGSPIVFLLSLYGATIYSYLYLCFTTFPRVFQGQYGFSVGSTGLVYLGIGIGSLLGLVVMGALSDRVAGALARRNGGEPKPEYRLPTLMLGAAVV